MFGGVLLVDACFIMSSWIPPSAAVMVVLLATTERRASQGHGGGLQGILRVHAGSFLADGAPYWGERLKMVEGCWSQNAKDLKAENVLIRYFFSVCLVDIFDTL